MVVGALAVVLAACGAEAPESEVATSGYATETGALAAYCTATVIGKGVKDVETDYLPRVIRCENGSAPLEALKAQAVAARSYLYYKLNSAGQIADGQSDQVYTCTAQPSAIHYQAVNETAGIVLRYSNTQVAAFYVAGAIPTTANCIPKAGDNDWSNTEKYVTYNQGKSGSGLTQTTLGWVNAGNYANRGCKSQNGASCLAKAGWGYADIIKFYYGSDIQFVTATGTCIGGACACTAGATENQACGQCGQMTRTCGANCQWGAWSGCGGEGVCAPGASESAACGQCGQKTRTCTAQCGWSGWSDCGGQGGCAPGAVETESCGNCGQRSRSCSASCTYGGWSECAGGSGCTFGEVDQKPCGECGVQYRMCGSDCAYGPYGECVSIDPVDAPACNTSVPGVCAEGRLKCLGASVSCVGLKSASNELCNGLDDDCDGLTDDDATALPFPLPNLAATFLVPTAPETVAIGGSSTVTVSLRNDGALDWQPGTLTLMAEGELPGTSSPLYHESWVDAFTVATNAVVIPAGGVGDVTFEVGASGEGGPRALRLRLVHASGLIRCPDAELELWLDAVAAPVSVESDDADVVSPGDDAGGTVGDDSDGLDAQDGAGDASDGTSDGASDGAADGADAQDGADGATGGQDGTTGTVVMPRPDKSAGGCTHGRSGGLPVASGVLLALLVLLGRRRRET
jgi:hypothetical protein